MKEALSYKTKTIRDGMLSRLASQLSERQLHALFWLLCYPFLRAEDLALFVSDRSLSSTYHLLERLTQWKLIEWVHPASLGKSCYHLSNMGLYVVAHVLSRTPAELAHAYHTDEQNLLLLLPRLPSLTLVSSVIRSLVMEAGNHLGTKGEMCEVNWSFERDSRVQAYFSWAISASVVLRCRPPVEHFPDALRNEQSRRLAELHERWYRLLIQVDSSHMDQAAITHFLAEVEEIHATLRQKGITPFPALVIVTEDTYRAEQWRAAREGRGTEPLQAAILVLSSENSLASRGSISLWRRRLIRLSDGVTCTLRDLLVPLPKETLPTGLLTHLERVQPLFEVETRKTPKQEILNLTQQSGSRLAASAKNLPLAQLVVGRYQRRARLPGEEAVLAALTLTKRDLWLLRQLFAHPLLSEWELGAFLGVQRDSIWRYLLRLRQAGWVEQAASHPLWKTTPEPPTSQRLEGRWYITEKTLHLLAAERGIPVKGLTLSSEEVYSVTGKSTLLQHTLVDLIRQRKWGGRLLRYEIVGRMAEEARQRGGCLLWWQERAKYPFLSSGTRLCIQPHLEVAYQAGERLSRFWIVMNLHRISAGRLGRALLVYRRYILSRAWTPLMRSLPHLLWVALDPQQEERMAHVARQVFGLGERDLHLSTTTLSRLRKQGIFAPIWLPVFTEEGSRTDQRRTLIWDHVQTQGEG